MQYMYKFTIIVKLNKSIKSEAHTSMRIYAVSQEQLMRVYTKNWLCDS